MKTLRNIVFIFLSILNLYATLFAQSDSIYANVNKDSVIIWHKQTLRNCASRFLINHGLKNYAIKIIEIDTVGPIAKCLCYYDLSISIGHLPIGSYTVEIFTTDTTTVDTTYLGSTSFEIISSVSNQVSKLAQTQSDCYELTSVKNKNDVLPNDYELLFVYPNPFNPETNIEFHIPEISFVEILIYDTNGRELETVLSKDLERGDHNIKWDAKKYSSGVYYVTMKIGDKSITQKALLIK